MTDLSPLTMNHDGATLIGQIAIPAQPGPHRSVLVMSNAHGLGNQARERARLLAEQGYLALATDMYGNGIHFRNPKDAGGPISELLAAPEKLRSRVLAWYETLSTMPEVDSDRIAAIGFCFGGQCVLELARGGADVKAVVSYHGLLGTAMPAKTGTIRGHVTVYTGDRDPYVPREHVDAFCNEMHFAEARWQITVFGGAYHAFTDPEADASSVPGVRYDALADRLSWTGTLTLLEAAL